MNRTSAFPAKLPRMLLVLVYAYQGGMNCLLAASPFPPVTTSTTTTTTTTTTTSGGGRGDPHIYTLGGEHYLLLGQGQDLKPLVAGAGKVLFSRHGESKSKPSYSASHSD